MNEPLQPLLAVLNRAVEGVERCEDPWLCSIVVTALQRELVDLGYRSPVDPEVSLQLQQIKDMLSALRPSGALPETADPAPAQHPNSLSQLKTIVGECATLTICDPYLLQGLPGISPQAHVTDLENALPARLSQLEIFVKPGKRHQTISAGLHEVCASRGIALIHRLTPELHDRVWVFDHRRAFAIGASFNGLIDKCAFILELSRDERERFLGKLKALRPNARWAPGAAKGLADGSAEDSNE